MSAPICPTCDRHFVTTARFVRKLEFFSESPAAAFATTNPYAFNSLNDDFQVVSNRRQASAGEKPSLLPVLFAAIFLPWIGMIMNKQSTKGVFMLLAMLLWLICGFSVWGVSQMMLAVTAIAGMGLYIVGLVDVYSIARKRANGYSVGEWDWF
ncbi:MAG TPA: hypothetical protein VG944_24105 [Fimbriimonas sp.]|nr:hypothetical protein [Fimbriimonas sp.]